jgi:hypothetical protein
VLLGLILHVLSSTVSSRLNLNRRFQSIAGKTVFSPQT